MNPPWADEIAVSENCGELSDGTSRNGEFPKDPLPNEWLQRNRYQQIEQ
jgi:hypothetical protein